MTAYNGIVKYYQHHGFQISIQNLQGNSFRYKLSPTGYPQNYSFFSITSPISRGQPTPRTFEIHHNIAIESGLTPGVYCTPDISVILANTLAPIQNQNAFFLGSNRSYYAVSNQYLQTFAEVKNYEPFPELLVSFIGILNELTTDIFLGSQRTQLPRHIAPALILSGFGSTHVRRFRDALMLRYEINIFFGYLRRRAQIYRGPGLKVVRSR